MTRDMSHDEASESLAAAALDALSAEEQAAVLAHAASCPRCGPELDALRQALAALGNSTPAPNAPATPDVEQRLKRIRMRLLARAQADRAGLELMNAAPSATVSRAASEPASRFAGERAAGSGAQPAGAREAVAEGAALNRPSRRPAIAPWVALAAAIVVVVLLLNQRRATNALLVQANQNAATAKAALDTAQAKIDQDNRELQDLTGPKTAVVSLSTAGAAEATAHMFWDRADNSWSFYAHHMPPPPAGKTYQIWLLTPTGQISAGTFTPAADSSVEVHATYALPSNGLKGVAVSEEPAGGVPRQTGRVVIIGTPTTK